MPSRRKVDAVMSREWAGAGSWKQRRGSWDGWSWVGHFQASRFPQICQDSLPPWWEAKRGRPATKKVFFCGWSDSKEILSIECLIWLWWADYYIFTQELFIFNRTASCNHCPDRTDCFTFSINNIWKPKKIQICFFFISASGQDPLSRSDTSGEDPPAPTDVGGGI